MHKLFRFAINVNSVTASQTMFAARVCELQALGSIVLSNYSQGMQALFPNVKVYPSASALAQDLRAMHEKEILELRLTGIRQVMRTYSCFETVPAILLKIGVPCKPIQEKPILVVADRITEGLRTLFAEQSVPLKELTSEADMRRTGFEAYGAVAFWKSTYHYGPYYLEDMFNAFRYTACDYITRDAYYRGGRLVRGVMHQYVSRYQDAYKTLFWAGNFAIEALKRGGAALANGYATDPVGIDVAPARH
jgi:hypothetical protein